MRASLIITGLCVCAALAGCGKSGLRLLDERKNAPDEFLVLPAHELEDPADYNILPTPTPGGVNRTDRDPQAEAIAALGGNADAARAGDAALLTATNRYGVQSDIRQELSEEDEQLRKRNKFLINLKLFPTDNYAEIYEKQTLDAAETAISYQNSGIPTPNPGFGDE